MDSKMSEPLLPLGELDTRAALGVLDERVTNLYRRVAGLEQTVTAGFAHMEASLSAVTQAVASAKTPNWSAMATWAGVCVAFGVAVYAPVLRAVSDLDTKVEHRVTLREAELIRDWTRERSDTLSGLVRDMNGRLHVLETRKAPDLLLPSR